MAQKNELPDGSVDDGSAARDAALAAETDTVEGEMERLRADMSEASDRMLRAQAELENYRKRARRELEDERRYANLPLLRDLLPVLDNMQRAIGAAEKNPDGSNLLEGIKMVAQHLLGTLNRYHCQKIEALHQPFDPSVHEAISQVPTTDHPPGTVIAVAQDGYTLHDRVVRPAQVIVSAAAAS